MCFYLFITLNIAIWRVLVLINSVIAKARERVIGCSGMDDALALDNFRLIFITPWLSASTC